MNLIWQMLASLGIVVGIIYLFFLLAKKRQALLGLGKGAANKRRIKMLEHQEVNQRLSLSLFCIDHSEFLVISSPHGMRTIKLWPPRSEDKASS